MERFSLHPQPAAGDEASVFSSTFEGRAGQAPLSVLDGVEEVGRWFVSGDNSEAGDGSLERTSTQRRNREAVHPWRGAHVGGNGEGTTQLCGEADVSHPEEDEIGGRLREEGLHGRQDKGDPKWAHLQRPRIDG